MQLSLCVLSLCLFFCYSNAEVQCPELSDSEYCDCMSDCGGSLCQCSEALACCDGISIDDGSFDPQSYDSEESESNLGLIIGAVVGALVVLIVAFVVFKKCKRAGDGNRDSHTTPMDSVHTTPMEIVSDTSPIASVSQTTPTPYSDLATKLHALADELSLISSTDDRKRLEKASSSKQMAEALLTVGQLIGDERKNQGQAVSIPDHKFSVKTLTFGDKGTAMVGLKSLLAMDTELGPTLDPKNPLKSIEDEWRALEQHPWIQERLADNTQNEYWKRIVSEAAGNLDYVLNQKATDETGFPQHMQEQVKNKKYHGGSLAPGDIDFEHEDQTFNNFCTHPSANAVGLNAGHVLALRLYTSSSYPLYNEPLRSHKSTKPCVHPLPCTLVCLDEGLKKLRGVQARRNKAEFASEMLLFRGMKNMDVDDEFLAVGGAELGCMSTTANVEVAAKYSDSANPLLFMINTKGEHRGISVQWLSIYPKEMEFLYPPLTTISCEKSADGHADILNFGKFRVVSMTPGSFGGSP